MRTVLVLVCVFGLSRASSLFDENLYRAVLDPELCLRQLETMDKLQFYDSSFHIPQGLLHGHSEDYGNYHQCLGISQRFHSKNIEGKYCLIRAHFSPPTLRIPALAGASDTNNLTWMEFAWPKYDESAKSTNESRLELRLAVCVPRACSVGSLLLPFVEHPIVRFNYSEEFCRLPGDKPYVAADYIAVVILSLLGLLTIISTTYDLHHTIVSINEPLNELLRSWSVYTNTSRILTFGAPQSLVCLDGIRALSVLWIIIDHSAQMILNESINKWDIIYGRKGRRQFVWVFTGHFAVDSFLVLSGLLLVYTTANKIKQLTVRSLPMLYLNRYVRLFPLLAAAILLQSAAVRVLDGPRDWDVARFADDCRNYWWSALLHIQNIVNPNSKCLGNTWYLSADMQLYVVASLVLLWIRSPRVAWRALAVAALASQAATLALCLHFHFANVMAQISYSGDHHMYWIWYYFNPITRSPPFFFGMLCGYGLHVHRNKKLLLPKVKIVNYSGDHHMYWIWYYFNPITRSPPFFFGMLCGYGLHVHRNKKLLLPKWAVFLGYSLALTLFVTAVGSEHPNTHTFWENQVALDIKQAFFRTCWALALCWLILTCAHGYGGPVNWFLSLWLWRFVARFSYGMYLFSYVIQRSLFTDGEDQYFDTQTLLWRFMGDVGASVALSVAAAVLVEAPFLALYNLLVRSRSQSRQNPC